MGPMTAQPSPLHEVHHDLGATFTEFAGWTMPVRYSSDLAEHHAVRKAAGLFDLSHMGEIEVTGPQAGQALDYALVGNIANLKLGRARYSMLCDSDGGVLDDLVVYRLAEDRFLVVANAANVSVVAEALTDRAERFADAQVTDVSAEYALIAVQGPASAEIVRTVCDADVDALKYYAATPTQVSGHDVLLSRTGYTGEDGFELYCAPDRAAQVWATLTEAGKPHQLQPAGLACRDTLRLEAGMPLYGNGSSSWRRRAASSGGTPWPSGPSGRTRRCWSGCAAVVGGHPARAIRCSGRTGRSGTSPVGR